MYIIILIHSDLILPLLFSIVLIFTFQHSLNQPVDVKVKIYTIAGRMIKEIESNNVGEKFVKINWDGRDGDGDMISNGTYLYKIIVKSSDGAFNQSVLGKLAVIR
ncbi:MAG: FlgD immunoglobulin-like domain containing protein [Ignavibacteriaceae bacterium]